MAHRVLVQVVHAVPYADPIVLPNRGAVPDAARRLADRRDRQRSGDIDAAIRKSLDEVPLEDFRDKVVAVHPNDTTASGDDKTACTQADTLRATIRYLKNLHPRSIVVTAGPGAKSADEVFKIMGFFDVIRDEGVEYHDHNQPPFVPVDLTFGPQRRIMVNERVLSYEKIVSLAQLKVHSTATVTMAIKNIAMSFPAAEYYGYPPRQPETPPAQHPGGQASVPGRHAAPLPDRPGDCRPATRR